MKHPYNLSNSNLILAIIISICVLFLNLPEILRDDSTAGMIGKTIGILIVIFAIPFAVSLIFWFVLGRKENGGSNAFGITMILILLGQCGSLSKKGEKKIKEDKAVDKLTEALSTYKEKVRADGKVTDSTEEEYSKKIYSGINDLVDVSTGEEKEFFQLMNGFMMRTDSIANQWSNSYSEFQKPRILDYSVLDSDAEFDFQITVLDNYIKGSESYKAYFEQRIPDLVRSIKSISNADKFNKEPIEVIMKKDSLQKPIFIPLINNHIEYGENVRELLTELRTKKGGWKYDNEELTFDQESDNAWFEELIARIGKNEVAINELAEQMIEVL